MELYINTAAPPISLFFIYVSLSVEFSKTHLPEGANLVVESACETHDRLDVGHKTKRYIFVPKTGVVKPKGIFYASIAATITDKNAIIKVPILQTFQ